LAAAAAFQFHRLTAKNARKLEIFLMYLSAPCCVVLCKQLPFRTNNYVIEELIDWSKVPDDPIFQLTFPQPGMLPAEWLEEVHDVRMNGGTAAEVRRAADKVRAKMNPHPAKQREMNVPNHKNVYDGETEFERGMQHKYVTRLENCRGNLPSTLSYVISVRISPWMYAPGCIYTV
jgi:hypothetical protein